MAGDHVEQIVAQWRRQRPDLDVSPMAVIARISRLSRILERQIEDMYASHGLNQSQFGVLAALRRSGPPYCLSPTDLYNSLLITSGAITHRVRRLTAAGLVTRVASPNDGRSLLVALTPAGKELTDRILAAHYENERRLLASLTPGDQAGLAGTLRQMLIYFGDAPPATAGGHRPGAVLGR